MNAEEGAFKMDGVLVIDKPAGPTSHDVVRKVRRRLDAKKVGHLGTLDPMATGVLPLVINGATKYAEFLSGGSKEYLATLTLGEERDTFDATGRVVMTRGTDFLKPSEVERTLMGFCGRIKQLPPMFSAVKKNGVPLYKLARRGLVVERGPKEVQVYSIDILAIEIPRVKFRAVCSKGTYIRTLCHDAGQLLGCGAYLSGLRRTRSGRFVLEAAVSPEAPKEVLLGGIIPLEVLLLGQKGARQLKDGRETFFLHSHMER